MRVALAARVRLLRASEGGVLRLQGELAQDRRRVHRHRHIRDEAPPEALGQALVLEVLDTIERLYICGAEQCWSHFIVVLYYQRW